VQKASSGRAPTEGDAAQLVAMFKETYGVQTARPDTLVMMNMVDKALLSIHEDFQASDLEWKNAVRLKDFVDGKPFVEVNGEYYWRYTEPKQ